MPFKDSHSSFKSNRVLLALIRDLGGQPCPRCHIKLDSTKKLGQKEDYWIRSQLQRYDDENRRKLIRRARKYIYKSGRVVKSTKVEALLKETSLVPTEVLVDLILPHIIILI